MDTSGLPFPKGEPRARTKRRAKRREQTVAARVRAAVMRRDAPCRVAGVAALGPCKGRTEWAHFEESRRFKTRGRPPEERHAVEGSLGLCRRHHHDYDQGRLAIKALSAARCEGRLRYRAQDGTTYTEE